MATASFLRKVSNNMRRGVASIPTYWESMSDAVKCIRSVMGVEDYVVAMPNSNHEVYQPLKRGENLNFVLDIVGTDHVVYVWFHRCENIDQYELTCYVSL